LKGHTGWIQDLALFSDGRRAVSTSSDGTLRVWDTERGTAIHCVDHHKDPLHGVAITPDERFVLTAFHVEDGQDHVYGVYVWDAKTWQLAGLQVDDVEKEEASFAHAGGLAISNNGALALAPDAYGSGWSVWRLADKKMLHRRLRGSAHVVSAIPVGEADVLVALENGAVERLDLTRGKATTVIHNTGGNGRGVSLSSDGSLIVTPADSNGIAVWDALTRSLVARATAESTVTACAVTPDGSRVLAGDESGRVYTMRLTRGSNP
jgi:WD40 repeat protein